MEAKDFNLEYEIDIAWCPGCGDYGILTVLKKALAELNIDSTKLVIVSGIGQAAKIPHYLKTNVFNGLHGRALPPATAIKAVNPELTVIAESGDGDIYGEGGNHFMHCIRRNPDITVIVHDNMVYGLTKGQASPTSQPGFKTSVQVEGVILGQFNPLAVALALDASFVARAFIGDMEQTKDIVKQAVTHKGFALVDIFQPCITYNKINTFQWFKANTYYLESAYDPHDRVRAFQRALETEKLPLGVFYSNPGKPVFEKQIAVYRKNTEPLIKRTVNSEALVGFIDKKRGIPSASVAAKIR